MFKHHIGITPLPINNLFIVNNAQHAYYTRQINSLHTQIGKTENMYTMFSFHGINIWNHVYATKNYQKGIFNGTRFHIQSHNIYNTLNTDPHFIFPCIPSRISNRSAGIH